MDRATGELDDQHRHTPGRIAAPSGETAATSATSGSPKAARGRRGFGEDSIFLDAATGRWCAVISLGRKPDGRRDRRKVTAKTNSEVLAKLRVLHRSVENGLAIEPRLTVGAYLDRWAAGLDTAPEHGRPVPVHGPLPPTPRPGHQDVGKAHSGRARRSLDGQAGQWAQTQHREVDAGDPAPGFSPFASKSPSINRPRLRTAHGRLAGCSSSPRSRPVARGGGRWS